MRNTRKFLKIYGIAAAMLLLTLVLAACGGETPTATPTTTGVATITSSATTAAATTGIASVAPATTAAVTPAATVTASATPVAVVDANLKTNLTVWFALPKGADSLFRDQLKRFGQMYPNAKVNSTTYTPEELSYQMELATASGKIPDLVVAPSDYVTEFVTEKALQSADKVFDKSFLDGFNANAMGVSNFGGTQWGIPYNYGGTAVMLYNKKLMDTPPATVSEMVTKAKEFNNRQEKTQGISIDVNEPFWFAAWVGGFGGSLMDSNNQPTLNSPQVINTLKFINDLVVKDKLANPGYEPSMNQTEYAFRDGRLAMMVTGDWSVPTYSTPATTGKAAKAGDDKLDLGVAPLPKIDSTGKSPIPFNNGRAFFFGTKSTGDQLKASQLFVEYLAKPEQQAETLNKAYLLPATKVFLTSDAVQKNSIWSGLYAALELSKPQPNAPEMAAIWAAIRPNLEGVVANTIKPEDAANQMQQMALDKIKLLNK